MRFAFLAFCVLCVSYGGEPNSRVSNRVCSGVAPTGSLPVGAAPGQTLFFGFSGIGNSKNSQAEMWGMGLL